LNNNNCFQGFTKISDEVYTCNKINKIISSKDFDCLTYNAKNSSRHRCRICTHMDLDSTVHEMFIAYTNEVYVRPHKQLNNEVSYYIIEGKASLILFNDIGDIEEVIKLDAANHGVACYCRLTADKYRMMLVESATLVFHEVTKGPFSPSQTIFAQWAPEEKSDKVQDFLITINKYLENKNEHV